MTLILFISTVAQQGDGSLASQLLYEAQRKFLPVILNCSIPRVD